MGRAFEYRKAAKMKRWDKMSRIFPKLAKAITIAAKEGGDDPDMKRASGKDASNFTEVNYEGKGPHGVLVYVECATDNTTRTIANIKYYFNKFGNGQVPSGSLEFLFNRKSVFEFTKTEDIDIEELEFELIDAGLEEIDEHDGTIYVYGDYKNFGTLQTAFEEKGIEISKARSFN